MPATEAPVNEQLLARLSEPETSAALNRLCDHLDLIVFALDSVDALMRRSDSILEGLHQGLQEAAKLSPGENVMDQVRTTLKAAPRLLRIGDQVVNAGLLDDRKLELVSQIGSALTEAMDKAPQRKAAPTGLFGLIGALKDPDINASVSLLLECGRIFGKRLRQNTHA